MPYVVTLETLKSWRSLLLNGDPIHPFDVKNGIIIRELGAGWAVSHVPGCYFRNHTLAVEATRLTISEAWTLNLSSRTLAKGNSLLEYVLRAKILNDLPKTTEEQAYLDALRPRPVRTAIGPKDFSRKRQTISPKDFLQTS